MTDDLVKRLRELTQCLNVDLAIGAEAADRIEEQDRIIVTTGKINIQLVDHTTKLIGRIWELEAALRLGVDMRDKQKAYFKRRFQDVLLDCKKAERDFDVSARAALGEKKDD